MDSATVLRDVLGAGWIATADADQLLIDAEKLAEIAEHVATIANRIGQIQLLCNVRREDGDGDDCHGEQSQQTNLDAASVYAANNELQQVAEIEISTSEVLLPSRPPCPPPRKNVPVPYIVKSPWR